MDKKKILDTIEPSVSSRGCFIVDVSVSKDNDIIVTIEKDEGTVDLEDCESVNDAFLAAFDKDTEDYSLTVTSAGLDQPFKTARQYKKAIGSPVEALLRNGKKIIGVLTGADDEGASVRHSRREQADGKKKKVIVEVEEKFTYSEINSLTPHIEFKK